MDDRIRAPLYECLVKHEASSPVSFHVPGHRNGQAWRSQAIRQGRGSERLERFDGILSIDVTEISATDDLHAPDNVIAEAQQLAARVFHADETMLLVGGSTAGNIAMILTVCEPGDIILVQRNVHKSVLNGLRLAGAKAVFLQPAYELDEGTALVPLLETVEQALQRFPEARAVMLSTPNYYGRGVSIKPYADIIHGYGIPLLIDEAHGAHYGLHNAFPESAVLQGADAVVQSTHKTLPAMTMGAMLHVRGQLIDRERLRDMLAVVQSSSPSFPIMASLDIARAMIEENGPELFEPGLGQAATFRQEMQRRNGRLFVAESEKEPSEPENLGIEKPIGYVPNWNGEVRIDPLRVIMRDKLCILSGYELLRMLEKHGCWAEMADEHRVLLLFGPFVSKEDTERLLGACEAIEQELMKSQAIDRVKGREYAKRLINIEEGSSGRNEEDQMISQPIPFSMKRINPANIAAVPLLNAARCISAETIIPYPPGIPLVYAGERLTETVITKLAGLVDMGAKCQGASDPTLMTIRIINQGKNT